MTPLESKPRGPRSVRPEGPFRWLEPGDLTEQIVLWGAVGTELARIRAQMKHIDDFVECDIDPPTRLLFIGPSGTGKSLAAWTIGAALGVPVCVADLGSFVGKYLGETSAHIAQAFRTAAGEGAILFLDELDGVQQSRSRGGGGDGAGAEMLRSTTTFFQQLDWAPKRQIIIAATNHPELIDVALVRRFTTQLTFDMPSRPARARLVSGWLSKVPDVSDEELERLVTAGDGISCADLRSQVMSFGRHKIVTRLKLEEAED